MKTHEMLNMQVRLAHIASSLYRKGNVDLASDIVMLASYNGTHVLFDDTNMDSIFMLTLHELLDSLGFKNIMKATDRKIRKRDPVSPYYPGNVSALN